MKYTGWAVLIVGVLIGIYGLFVSMPHDPGVGQPAADASQPSPIPLGTITLVFSAIAIAGGLAMLLLGGRGVIKTKNLSVRN
jgi:hypothetical protein